MTYIDRRAHAEFYHVQKVYKKTYVRTRVTRSKIQNSENEIPENRIINVVPYVHRLTLDVISSIAFGTHFGTIEDPEKEWTDKVNYPKLIAENSSILFSTFLPIYSCFLTFFSSLENTK